MPAGQTGEADLAAALDNVFNHPNVGPFIAKRLIERLVTSNPDPAYIERVASTFDDDGTGERGNLEAVIRAILLDDEARDPSDPNLAGKMKEPLLRVTQLWRAYDAASMNGQFRSWFPASVFFGQGPLQSPSVFNFFSPFYAPPGEIRDGGWVAPELEIATEYQNTQITGFFVTQALDLTTSNESPPENMPLINITAEEAIAADSQALVDLIADKLLGGEISDTLRQETIDLVEMTPDTDRTRRAAHAIYMITASPEFAFQN